MSNRPDDGKVLTRMRAAVDQTEARIRHVAGQIDNRQLERVLLDCATKRSALGEQIDEAIAEHNGDALEQDNWECCAITEFDACEEANRTGDYSGLLERLADCDQQVETMLSEMMEQSDLSATVRLAVQEALLLLEETIKQLRRIVERSKGHSGEEVLAIRK
ncbi:hypothetical protein [Sphingomicrobium sediminis]|uniref:DUF2383 domain-containing protein n=1 Tax=Sphingomicrobium sediminis TaxID=2950949 RepID=A0A9X2EID9_9SPHN|nr:hypothetical protein [Sphingomicrobium sediminis]MCM8557326.1 hypothetical protein [Sphingomicrobium sediminis]